MPVKGADEMARVGEAAARGDGGELVVRRCAQDFRLVKSSFDQVVYRTFPVGGEEESGERAR